jgi:hypothetical protein
MPEESEEGLMSSQQPFSLGEGVPPPSPAMSEHGSITGLDDTVFDLISVLYHAAKSVWMCQRYIHDAAAPQQHLRDFFRAVHQEDQRRVQLATEYLREALWSPTATAENGVVLHPYQEYASPIQVGYYLKGAEYPARKAHLIRLARHNGAPANVIATLQDVSEETFLAAKDVARALGELAIGDLDVE